MSGGNPYSSVLDMIREAAGNGAAPAWDYGVVLSTSPAQIHFRGVKLLKEQLLLAPGLTLAVGKRVAVLPHASYETFLILAMEA